MWRYTVTENKDYYHIRIKETPSLLMWSEVKGKALFSGNYREI